MPRIAHSLQDLQQQLILTFQDQPLLSIDQPILHNASLTLQRQAHHNTQLRQKIKRAQNDVVALARELGEDQQEQQQAALLPYYDQLGYRVQGIEVGDDGAVEVSAKVLQKKNKLQEDFMPEGSNAKPATDYQSAKPIKFKTGRKVKEDKKASDLLDFLEATAQPVGEGKEKQQQIAQSIEQSLQQLKKRQRLLLEMEQLWQKGHKNDDQQDQLLKGSKMGRKMRKIDEKQIAAMAREQINQQAPTQQLTLNPISFRPSDQQYQKKEYDFTKVRSGLTSAMFLNLPSQRRRQTPTVKHEYDDMSQLTPQAFQKMKQQRAFLDGVQAGTGLSGALDFLRQHALLGQQQQAGRSTDKSLNPNNPTNGEIKLQYRNSNGKLMKPKQAFRFMCQVFHGQGPGKNKLEKRRKKQLLDVKLKQATNRDGTFMGLLKRHQMKTGQSHMTVQFKKK